jgi:DNA repair protein RecO (recombination protein O)
LIRQRDEAFVLDTRELGEADLIVTLFGEHHGKVRAVAPSARKSRRRFGGVLEPLTRVRASWVERSGRQLHRLEQIEGVRSFADMQSDPLRQATCAVLAEVASRFCNEGQSDPQAFRLMAAVLEALEAGTAPWAILRYFEYWTLRIHGLLPDLERCAVCGRGLAATGPLRVGRHLGALCRECPRGSGDPEAVLSVADREFLASVRRLPPAAMPPAAGAGRGSSALEFLLRGMLEAFAERSFRTYKHFRAAAR